MLPLDMFASRQFTAVNVVTFVVYGALGGGVLPARARAPGGGGLLAAGRGRLAAAARPLPMLLLSARAGALAQRIGPRWLMTGGLLTAAAGLLLLTRIGPQR